MSKQWGLVECRKFATAHDFVDAIRPSSQEWIIPGRFGSGWIYRGQSDASHGLLPSAWRLSALGQRNLIAETKDLLTKQKPEWVQAVQDQAGKAAVPSLQQRDIGEHRSREAGLQLLAEFWLVRCFASLADDVGHSIQEFTGFDEVFGQPGGFAQFFAGAGGSPKLDQAFAFAQHHGVPTRLLDFTFSPLVAAFFASDGICERTTSGGLLPNELAVWAINMAFLDQVRVLRAMTVPRHELPFLHAQSGLFLWAPNAQDCYIKTGAWQPFEVVLDDQDMNWKGGNWDVKQYEKPIRKYTLGQDQAGGLAEILWAERVSQAHLMPTFDNVTHAIRRLIGLGHIC